MRARLASILLTLATVSGMAACNALTGGADLEVCGVGCSEGGTSPGIPVGRTDARSPDARTPTPSPTTTPPITDASTAPVDAGVDARVDARADASEPSPSAWTQRAFADQNRLGTCTGAKYVTYNQRYSLWVGVTLCSPTRYKIYLSTSVDGTFYETADGSGGGEDHCEFVNPTFTLGPSGEMNGGNCPSCQMDYAGTGVTGQNAGAFTRSNLGEAPRFNAQWPAQNYTAHWFECGVSIP